MGQNKLIIERIEDRRLSQKTRKTLRILAWIAFFAYLLGLAYFLFFAEMLGRGGVGTNFAARTYHLNLVPFREIRRFWIYRHLLGQKAVLLNLLGNVLAFVPYGLLLPLLWHRQRHFYRILLLSFDFSLLIEVIQLVTKVGCFDVDDLILNTLGGVIGYGCFKLVMYWRKRRAIL